jgi:glycerol-1-phosphate dehydrogenase [NAD(P)+]
MGKIWALPQTFLTPLAEIQEQRSALVVTTLPAYDAVKKYLALSVTSLLEVQEATLPHWDSLLAQAKPAEVVYAIGGGLAFDAAKYIAVKKGLPLVGIPTALSVDAFFAWSSAIREGGCVRYLETKAVDNLLIDFAFISTAPPHLRAAAICDLLSIATGCWDWQLAERRSKNPPAMAYQATIEKIAQAILAASLECAHSAGAGDIAGLKQLLDCLALETQLLNQVGHARPEEGSEHYFAYLIENEVGKGKSHAELVCPGILLTAALQGQDWIPLKQAIQACHIPLNSLPLDLIRSTLLKLPEFVHQHDLPYGIAHEITAAQVQGLDLAALLAESVA